MTIFKDVQNSKQMFLRSKTNFQRELLGRGSGRELIIRGMPVNQNHGGVPRRKSGYEQRLHSAITEGERAALLHWDGMQISAALRETCREVTAKIRGRGTMKLL